MNTRTGFIFRKDVTKEEMIQIYEDKINEFESKLAELNELYLDREHYTLAALGERFIKIMVEVSDE